MATDNRQPTTDDMRFALHALALAVAPALSLAQQVPVRKEEAEAAMLAPGALARLRWLEGRWRGEGDGQAPFFESYRFLDDSAFVSHSWADSTFGRATDSSRYELRGGRLANVGDGPRWGAVEVSDTLAVFVPLARARNGFLWRRETNDAWTATIRWQTPQGPRERVYRMRRVGG